MDKNIKNKLEQFKSYLKLAKKKKLFIYKFNNLTLENGFELDYFSTKKKISKNVNINYFRYPNFVGKGI